jgi:List-Bact-rpt repeat protein/type IX secretion system substrate protein
MFMRIVSIICLIVVLTLTSAFAQVSTPLSPIHASRAKQNPDSIVFKPARILPQYSKSRAAATPRWADVQPPVLNPNDEEKPVVETAIASDGENLALYHTRYMLAANSNFGYMYRMEDGKWMELPESTKYFDVSNNNIDIAIRDTVMLLVHSGGNNNSVHFRTNQTGEWRAIETGGLPDVYYPRATFAMGRPHFSYMSRLYNWKAAGTAGLQVEEAVPGNKTGNEVECSGYTRFPLVGIDLQTDITGDDQAWYAACSVGGYIDVLKANKQTQHWLGDDAFYMKDEAEDPKITILNGRPVVAWTEEDGAHAYVAHWNGDWWDIIGIVDAELRTYSLDIAASGNDLYFMYITKSGSNRIRVNHWDGSDWTLLPTGIEDDPSSVSYSDLCIWRGKPIISYEESDRLHIKAYDLPMEVYFDTEPPGLEYKVGGTTYNTPQKFTWQLGERHNISVTTPQAGASGSRYVLNHWSDSGAAAHGYIVENSGPMRLTAVFDTEYLLDMKADPGGDVMPPPGENWFTKDLKLPILSEAQPGFEFDGWEGSGEGSYTGTLQDATITMKGPITQNARFTGLPIEVSIRTDPVGRRYIVDGIEYSTTKSFSWDLGSTHNVEAVSPQPGAPHERYVWSGWSDGGSIAHTIIPQLNSPIDLTAWFNLEYELTMNASAGGSVFPSTRWVAPSSMIEIRATADPGSTFERWEGSGVGSYTGTQNPVSLTMNGPLSQTAWFKVVDGINDPVLGMPRHFVLHQNYPNPFNPSTTISFDVPMRTKVSLIVTDALGREVSRPIQEQNFNAGMHSVRFDSGNLPSGIYLYRLETNRGVLSRKMLLKK